MRLISNGWLEVTTDWNYSIDRKPEDRRDNPKDIANDEEAAERGCQCLIHSPKQTSSMKSGYQLNYKLNGKD